MQLKTKPQGDNDLYEAADLEILREKWKTRSKAELALELTTVQWRADHYYYQSKHDQEIELLNELIAQQH